MRHLFLKLLDDLELTLQIYFHVYSQIYHYEKWTVWPQYLSSNSQGHNPQVNLAALVS